MAYSPKRKTMRRKSKLSTRRKTSRRQTTRKTRILSSLSPVASKRMTMRAKRLGAKTRAYRMKRNPELKTKWQIEHQSLGIGPLLKGKLSQYGYHSYKTKTERTQALKMAVKDYGALSIFRSLNALAVYNKNTNPEAAKVFVQDRNMVRKMYM